MSNDLLEASAGDLARLIRQRRFSSREIVEAHLRRIEQVNSRINAVVQLDFEGAMRSASAADESLARGAQLGPLHGVPFTVKDWIETEGLICAAGLEERRTYVPSRDATVVARLKSAGGILLGKTNVGAGAPVYPRPNNPYGFDRSPGASSSGEAAIVAAGGSPLGLASDSGGSIRLPADWCGVAGLKPTNGLVPITGHYPRIGALSDPRTTIGPLARRVEDLGLALRVLAGPDSFDPAVIPVPLGDERSIDVASLRVAWFTQFESANPTRETVTAVETAVRVLREHNALVREARPPRIDESLPITRAYWARIRSASWSEWRTWGTSSLAADDIERSIFEWERFQRAMFDFMRSYDVVITPVSAAPASDHRQLNGEDYIYTIPWSLTGQPAVVVRCATSSEGLPIGVQIVAGRWRDQTALMVARLLENALGGWSMAEIA